VAWRLNAFAAICTALTASAVVLLATLLEANAVAALSAALAFAFGSSVWIGATHASPHTLSSLLIVGALLGSVAFARFGRPWTLLAACGCTGFGLATHPETIWVIPAIAVSIAWQLGTMRVRLIALCTSLVLVPLLLYAYLPIRSSVVAAQHLDPSASAPLYGAGGRLDWDFNQTRTLDGFLNEVLGRKENAAGAVKGAFNPRIVGVAAQLFFDQASNQYALVFELFAVLGAIALGLQERRSLSVLFAGTAGGVMFAYIYRLDAGLPYYFLASFAVTAALAAAACRITLPRTRPPHVAAAVTIALILIACGALANNRGLITALRFSNGQATIDAVARDTPDGAIVLSSWSEAQSLGYGSFVEHALGSRILISGFPDGYLDQYVHWTRVRPLTIYASIGYMPSVSHLPPAWLHERPSTRPLFRIFEVKPTP
jgi:hypothetical protein